MASPPSPDRFLRLNIVLDRTGLSQATLYRKIAAGTFPPQHKLADRCCGWRESEVNIWQRNPIALCSPISRRSPPELQSTTPYRARRRETALRRLSSR